MPNRKIEIHDSTLHSISMVEGAAVVRFSAAYIHESQGRPGVDVGTGRTQEVLLRIPGAVVKGAFSDLPCDMLGGHIKFGGAVLDKMIPIPLQYRGDVELQLEADGIVVGVTGTGVE